MGAMASDWQVVIIGGGAAGLMCAIEAGKRGRRVVLLEHNAEIGRKILISGGGRCNFTNLRTKPENFLSRNPHFAKSALARYTPADFLALATPRRSTPPKRSPATSSPPPGARHHRDARSRMRRGGS